MLLLYKFCFTFFYMMIVRKIVLITINIDGLIDVQNKNKSKTHITCEPKAT